MRLRPQVIILAAVVGLGAGPFPSAQGREDSGPAAAERQYRIARRLAAEGSAEAAAALEKVIALDPKGELVDDALVDHALLLGAAAWPEDLGMVTDAGLQQAVSHLDRILGSYAGGDRAVEARFLRALSRLEPLGGNDASAARLGFLDIASRAPGGPWDRRARYTRAWMDERRGATEQALATYQRLLVDSPGTPCADRARLGQARLLLRTGDYGRAARYLQEALDGGVEDPTAPALRELAVRALLRRAGRLPEAEPLEPMVAETGIRQFIDMAVFPDGGVLLAGRRAGVVRFGGAGEPAGHWKLDALQALAVDARGVAFAAAGDHVYRLDPGAEPQQVAGLGELSPVSALTVDGEGRFWILDRRGDRLASLQAGAQAPVVVWRVKGKRLNGIVSDGARILAVDTRAQSVMSIARDGQEQTRAVAVGERPGNVSADPTGRLAILDAKSGTVAIVPAERSIADSFVQNVAQFVPLKEAGVDRPAAAELGTDGRLHVFDSSTGAWLRTP